MNEILIILQAVDNAESLIDSGIDLAENLKKTARFVYPIETAEFGYYPPHGDPGPFPGDLTYNEALEKEKAIVFEILNEKILKKTANIFPSPKWTLDVLIGTPDTVLPDVLKNANLAFIFTDPIKSGDSNTLTYNVKAYLKSQPVPVIINSIEHPLHKIEKTVYATDIHEKDPDLIQDFLARLGKKTELTLLHVSDEKNSSEAVGSILTSDMFPEGTSELNKVSLYDEDIASGIKTHLQKHPADLLVLFKQNKSFWEKLFNRSESKKIMAETDIPVLIYHE
ncbi:MAG: hypothetical protein ACOC10_00460 [Bacteroidota bacterium]